MHILHILHILHIFPFQCTESFLYQACWTPTIQIQKVCRLQLEIRQCLPQMTQKGLPVKPQTRRQGHYLLHRPSRLDIFRLSIWFRRMQRQNTRQTLCMGTMFVVRRVFSWVGSLETSRSAIYFAYLTCLTYYAYLICYAYLTYYTYFQEGDIFKCEPAPACHRMHAIDLGVIVTLIKTMMWQRLGWISGLRRAVCICTT